MSTTTRRPAASRSSVLLVLGILLVAANLRPALTSVGPVLPALRADLGLGAAGAGALTALPLVAFAAVALVTPAAARVLGTERALVAGLLLVAAGTAVRSTTGTLGAFAGTAVLAVGIGAANVLLPALVKSSLPHRVATVTSWYAAMLTLAAALASGVAAPIAEATSGGWRTALGCWGVLALVPAAAWAPAALRRRSTPPRGSVAGAGVGTSPWRSPVAWWVAAYFALQSAVFYSVVAWLPTALVDRGDSASTAGLHLLVYQLTGLVGTLLTPLVLRGRADQRGAAVAGCAVLATGLLGLALLPGSSWVWTAVGGLGSGAIFALALTLITLRSADAVRAASLSAMAQSSGYLVAAIGPLAVGTLHEITGSWTPPLLLLAALGVAGALTGLRAGAARTVG